MAGWLSEAKAVDTAVYAAVAGSDTPLLDTAMVRDAGTQEFAAELDKRGDQEQATTA